MTENRIVAELAWRGGAADARVLRRISRRGLERALESGVVVQVAKGRYVLRDLGEAAQAAHRLTGAQSHLSAALAHGWGVSRRPERPHVTVPRGRKVNARESRRVILHWRALSEAERRRRVTDPLTTVIDCARDLPFGEALAVADAALRSGALGAEELVRAAERLGGPGSARVRRVAEHADGRADNAFESLLRAIASSVRGLNVSPQVRIGDLGARVDLADEQLCLILEADSFQWHGGRVALAKDARRYDEFVADGWLVLRFAFEDVLGDPAWVADILRRTVVVARATTTRRRLQATTA